MTTHCAACGRQLKRAPITAADALDIARLANLRMWEAYRRRDAAIEDMRKRAELAQA